VKRRALVLIGVALVAASCGSAKKTSQAPLPPAQKNGKIIYSLSQNTDEPVFENCPGLWTVNPDGTDLAAIGPDNTVYPAVSPDGRWLTAFLDGRDGLDLWAFDLTSGRVRRLAAAPHISSIYVFPYVTWTANGDAVLLVQTVRGRDEITRIEVPTGKAQVLATAGKEELAYPSSSPDGSRIAYTRFVGQKAAVWLMTADGSNKHELIGRAMAPTWSPTGSRIAVFRTDYAPEEQPLVSVAPDGGKQEELTSAFNGGPSSIRWEPNGNSLLFERQSKKPLESYGTEDIYRLELSTHHETLVAHNANLAGWAPAGDRILYSKQFPPSGNLHIGIYAARPDGSDPQLISVQDDEDVNIHSDPVWQPEAGKVVVPPKLGGTSEWQKCATALERVRRRLSH
jgi:Tol biopolymer transport system component